MKKTIWILLVVAAGIGLYLFFNQSHPKEVEATTDIDSTYIKIGVLPTSECLPFLVAEQCGIADSAKLKLKVILFDAAMDADTAFQKGMVDGLVSDMVKLSIMESHGEKIRAVMGGDLHLSLVTTRQSRITESKNLKDKIISITRNSIIDMYADKLLSKEKMESTDMNKPQINSLPVRLGMLLQNEYDGAILPEPWASISVHKGNHRISSITDIPEINNMFVLLFSDSLIVNRHDDISKLIDVYNKSVNYINHHRQSDIKTFLKMLQIQGEYTDSVLGIEKYQHATQASVKSLSICRTWSKSRNLLGNKSKSDIIENGFIMDKEKHK